MGKDRLRGRAEGGVRLIRDGAPQRVLYGRRKGRPLRPGRRALLEERLPARDLTLPDGGARLDLAPLFAGCADIWLEIGFGAGEHLLYQAAANPGVGFIGCEPYLGGVARLLGTADDAALDRIRVFRDDARQLLTALPDAAIGRAFVLFPDPWPKTRHHKRRIVAPDTLAQLARVLKDGAELRAATDIDGYKAWMLQHLLASCAFEWTARRPGDWRDRPADWPETRYERKARAAGRTPAFFRFRRRARRPRRADRPDPGPNRADFIE